MRHFRKDDFGEGPNAFLAAQRHLLPAKGRALAVADGEGRNGVWLAEQGLEVLSLDFSPVAQAKARQLATERGVKLTTSAGTNGEPVAQTAIAGLLMLARRFPQWLDAQRRHAWEPMRGESVPADLRGQTVMVVGLGVIGMPIARFCQALGMHVIGIRRTPKSANEPLDEIHPPARFGELLPRCQWLVLACPHTKETHHMLNAAMIEKLPRGAGLINVARGGVVEEQAVIAALKSGQLGCAHLDVFEKEPLPADSPLWDIPNVIVSPHNASASSGNDIRAAKIFTENIKLYAAGKRMDNEQS